MENLWDNFIDLLSQISENYRQLLQLGQEKQKVLVKADIEGLGSITKQEEIIVLKINQMEKQRIAAVKEIAAACKLQAPEKSGAFIQSVFEIKKLAGDKDAARIDELAQKLNEDITELTKLNSLNEQLIKQSLEFIEFNINLLSAASYGPTYSPESETSNEPPQSLSRRNILNTKA